MKRVLIALVRGYQLLFSAWVGGQCRFTPTCSHYAIEALRRHGAGRGTYLGAARVLRCQPWCRGGHDPVPEVFRWRAWANESAPSAEDAEDLEVAEAGDVANRAGRAQHAGESGRREAS